MRSQLTLGEVEEGKQHGINADTYDRLKQIFGDRAVEKARATMRTEILEEVGNDPKLRAKLKSEVQEELESKFDEGQRAKLRDAIQAEVDGQAPTVKQRDAARRTAREIEMDALTSSRAASTLAEQTKSQFGEVRAFRLSLFYGLLLSFLPVMAYCYHIGVGWISFLALAIPYVIAICAIGDRNGDYFRDQAAKIKGLQTRTHEYRAAAAKAREIRMVGVDAANTRGELVTLIRGLAGSERYTENTDLILPADALEAARAKVRDELASDMDPERFLRVSGDDDTEEPDPKRASA